MGKGSFVSALRECGVTDSHTVEELTNNFTLTNGLVNWQQFLTEVAKPRVSHAIGHHTEFFTV